MRPSKLPRLRRTLALYSVADDGLGIDIGYQWVRDRLCIALVLGVTTGYCVNCSPDVGTPLTGPGLERDDHVSVGINPSLLRVGFAY
ncbi:MAG: hypothetical protein ACOZIN_07605 [Myxococcota bacterium]